MKPFVFILILSLCTNFALAQEAPKKDAPKKEESFLERVRNLIKQSDSQKSADQAIEESLDSDVFLTEEDKRMLTGDVPDEQDVLLTEEEGNLLNEAEPEQAKVSEQQSDSAQDQEAANENLAYDDFHPNSSTRLGPVRNYGVIGSNKGEQSVVITPNKLTVSDILANPEKYANDPRYAPYMDQAREVLHLGSNESLIALAKNINPEIIKRIEGKNIHLNSSQERRLTELLMNNKTTLITSLITGSYPEDLMNQAAEIVPELKEVEEKDKKELFDNARKTVSNTVFERMIKAEAQLGYLMGDVSSGVVAQINARLLNVRKITFGDITIEDVHAEVQIGYPQNGFLLLSGKVSLEDKKYTFEGQLLGLTYDIRKRALEIDIANMSVSRRLFPGVYAYGNLGLGVGNYADGTALILSPAVGVRAERRLGPIRVEGHVEHRIELSDRVNTVLSCGASAGLDIIDNETVKVQTGIMSELTVQSNPRERDNRAEWLNSLGVSGEF